MILHWGLYISVFFISTVLYQYMCWHDPSLRVMHFSVFHQYSFISVHVLAWSFTEGYTFQCFSSVQFYISTCVGMILHWGLYISVFFISTVLYQYMCWYDPSLRVIHFSVFHQYSFISVHVLACFSHTVHLSFVYRLLLWMAIVFTIIVFTLWIVLMVYSLILGELVWN